MSYTQTEYKAIGYYAQTYNLKIRLSSGKKVDFIGENNNVISKSLDSLLKFMEKGKKEERLEKGRNKRHKSFDDKSSRYTSNL